MFNTIRGQPGSICIGARIEGGLWQNQRHMMEAHRHSIYFLPWLLSPSHAQQGWIPGRLCGIPRCALRCTSHGRSARLLSSLLRPRRHSYRICENENGCGGIKGRRKWTILILICHSVLDSERWFLLADIVSRTPNFYCS